MKLQLSIFSIICAGFVGGCQFNAEITQNAIIQSNGKITPCESFDKGDNLHQLMLNNQRLQLTPGCHNNSFRGRSVALGVR
ncbi:hypothetical protein [Tolypothrix sp. VBCCA 56010]|uniref:hypothetical protein n=1 Tax=Tolypothrix sp. VBCCA 56010 TaxID=3137731 RepID=UPI003D7CEB8F